ncbi:MAG: preprotein translocase subunit SecE [Lachnospiraceae bacterium]|nr:preprotein translocase subunit SecE [Lachnospiraceae bacterium]
MEDSVKTDKAPKQSFFKGVKAEFKKIAWPTRNEIVKQSIAVVCVSVVTGVIIAVIDFLFQYGIDFLTTL